MRASDLMGRSVVAADGGDIGFVIGVRAVQDGPLRGVMAVPRVDALIVSRHHVGSFLGYQERDQKGPWLIAAAVRRLHRGTVVVPWNEVDHGTTQLVWSSRKG